MPLCTHSYTQSQAYAHTFTHIHGLVQTHSHTHKYTHMHTSIQFHTYYSLLSFSLLISLPPQTHTHKHTWSTGQLPFKQWVLVELTSRKRERQMIAGFGIWFHFLGKAVANLDVAKRLGRAGISTITWDQERENKTEIEIHLEVSWQINDFFFSFRFLMISIQGHTRRLL